MALGLLVLVWCTEALIEFGHWVHDEAALYHIIQRDDISLFLEILNVDLYHVDRKKNQSLSNYTRF